MEIQYKLDAGEDKPEDKPTFKCEKCKFKCRNKKDYNRHLSTRKHKMIIEDKKVSPLDNQWICECSTSYKFSSGLSRHKKKCEISLEIASKPEDKKESEAELEIKKLQEQLVVKDETITKLLEVILQMSKNK